MCNTNFTQGQLAYASRRALMAQIAYLEREASLTLWQRVVRFVAARRRADELWFQLILLCISLRYHLSTRAQRDRRNSR